MEAANENGLKFFVLDRINPINGDTVDGPLRRGKSSFTAFHPIPVRHGMTAGELAGMFKAERKLENLDLSVVRVQNWKRAQHLDETGLAWKNPSPNMRSLEAAVLYPGVGLPEFTNLSVGRGTRIPFELVGAPYIEPKLFAEALNRERIPGVEFLPVHFTPDASKFKDQRCGGVKILLTDRQKCSSVSIGIALARALRVQCPDAWEMDNFNKLLAHPPTLEAVKKPVSSLADIQALWGEGRRGFLKRRKPFLL